MSKKYTMLIPDYYTLDIFYLSIFHYIALVAVVVRFEWTIFWYSKIACLFVTEFGKLHSKLIQVSQSHLFIQLQMKKQV